METLFFKGVLSFHQVLKMIIGRHKNYVFHVTISLLKSSEDQAGQCHSCFLKGCGGGVNILPSPPIDHWLNVLS